jgi:hypothetical protein
MRVACEPRCLARDRPTIQTVPFLTNAQLADRIAGVDLADPFLRHFVSDLRTLEATGADPRWAMIVLLRHARDARGRAGHGVAG